MFIIDRSMLSSMLLLFGSTRIRAKHAEELTPKSLSGWKRPEMRMSADPIARYHIIAYSIDCKTAFTVICDEKFLGSQDTQESKRDLTKRNPTCPVEIIVSIQECTNRRSLARSRSHSSLLIASRYILRSSRSSHRPRRINE